ncbi:unnamed protein product [Psylliodes chrysocephalus]|uniref:Uncharacterized protein n=1 Tax=Psylliodes chrysocephalus TaxID=3402493 RepID=A0A9P0G3F6_9CUCU|nr:unnamed protein product [Psylliodes chrysocephala]
MKSKRFKSSIRGERVRTIGESYEFRDAKKDRLQEEKIAKQKKKQVKQNLVDNVKQQANDSDDSGDEAIYADDEYDCLSEMDRENSDQKFMQDVEPIIDPESVTPNIEIGDFLLVKYCMKKTQKYYVGEVEEIVDGKYLTNFLSH